MSLVKVYCEESPSEVMFFDQTSSRKNFLAQILKTNKVNTLPKRISESDLISIFNLINERLVDAFQNRTGRRQEEDGILCEIDGEIFFLNPKKYPEDRTLTSLNSLKKIIAFCIAAKSDMIIELSY